MAVGIMTDEHQLSKAKACQLVGLSRSTLYKGRVDWSERDAPVIAALNKIIKKRGRWGFWKCYHRLRADGYPWNFKRIHRVYCSMKLNMIRRTKKRKMTRQRHPMVAPSSLNDTWTLDFMRDTLYDSRPFRTLNVIDEGNREALRIECGTSISANRLTRVMSELVEVYGKPRAIRLDNGPEMTSHQFTDWAHDNGIELLFIQPGKPNQNAFIERFNRSFRTEVLDAYLFNSVAEAQAAADEWLTDYNECRSHESLGNVPPLQYMPREFNGGSLH